MMYGSERHRLFIDGEEITEAVGWEAKQGAGRHADSIEITYIGATETHTGADISIGDKSLYVTTYRARRKKEATV
jgi:hypothetical protein